MTELSAVILVEAIRDQVNSDDWLVQRGRFVETRFLLEVGNQAYLITIHAGRIESIKRGPIVMPQWVFALRASAPTWDEFWQVKPKPGFNDLMAMIKLRTMKLEGNQLPFIANLLYFKDVLASVRRNA